MPSATCPRCGKTGPLPPGAAGARIRCPACGERFSIAPPAPSPPAVREPPREVTILGQADLEPWEPPAPPAARLVAVPVPAPVAPATKPCPFCAETIQTEARKCRHCGELLDPVLRAAEESRRRAEESRRRAEAAPPVVVHHAPSPQQVVQSVTVGGHPEQVGCVTGCLVIVAAFIIFMIIGSMQR